MYGLKMLIAVVLVACCAATPAWTQSSDPGWLDSLRLQLTVDQNCEVRYFLNIRERESGTGTTYSARVQCEDGRQFDATRTDPATDFTIEACGQTVCDLKSKTEDKS